ncbi:MAG: hypothetical protein AMXMBFR61_21490 [Fimbriimonadales bacterium]
MAEFIYVVRPPRPTFVADATQEEANAVAAHFAYLQELRAEGRLLLAGRTEGAEFGIVVFVAEDADHADQTVHSDPAVYQGVFTADCYPFRLAFLVGRD